MNPFVIIALSDFDEDAKSLCRSMDYEVALISGARILELAAKKDMLPDEQVAQERAEMEMKASIVTFDRLKKSALNKRKRSGISRAV